jgi:cytochrome c oxidase subunit II
MKTIRILAILVFAALAAAAGSERLRGDETRVIPIHAKRFEFEPKEVRLPRGDRVVLELTSEDVKHGFFSRPLHFDEDVEPGKTTRIPIEATTPGTYTVICDRYCGSGHGNMKMTIVVE